MIWISFSWLITMLSCFINVAAVVSMVTGDRWLLHVIYFFCKCCPWIYGQTLFFNTAKEGSSSFALSSYSFFIFTALFFLNWTVEHVMTIISEMRAVCFAHLSSNLLCLALIGGLAPSLCWGLRSPMTVQSCWFVMLAYPRRVCTASNFFVLFFFKIVPHRTFHKTFIMILYAMTPPLTLLLSWKLPKKYVYLKHNSGETCTLQEPFISLGWDRC